MKMSSENRVLVVLLQIGAKDLTVKKTVSVLAHLFLLPQRANLGYMLSISLLMYPRC